ncbi:MAG: MFS transporter, partial [Candidatus Velthaea sp.]
AEAITRRIEERVGVQNGGVLPPLDGRTLAFVRGGAGGLARIVEVMVRRYPLRTFVALTLMVTQAFLYNAIFFTEALVLTTFFAV